MATNLICRAAIAAAALSMASAAQAADFNHINVDPSAKAAVAGAAGAFRHAQPVAGATATQKSTALHSGFSSHRSPGSTDGASGRPRYPADLEYQGGAVLTSVVHHAIFVNPTSSCAPNACWGDPIGFLRDLNHSDFIHVTDQYVGSHANGRYPVGANYQIDYPVAPGTPLTDLDVEIIAYSAAVYSGERGYGHIYHVFLMPGQDLCFDSSDSVCYSPDNFPTFFFCAYHSSFDVTGFGHVVYSAEPFQDVSGCSVRPGTPNGQLADSTNSVLSHEVFEAITDPDGDAWWNILNNGIFGEEIGDECSFLQFTATDVFFDTSDMRLNGKRYSVQPEYSNKGHVCQTGSPDGN